MRGVAGLPDSSVGKESIPENKMNTRTLSDEKERKVRDAQSMTRELQTSFSSLAEFEATMKVINLTLTQSFCFLIM